MGERGRHNTGREREREREQERARERELENDGQTKHIESACVLLHFTPGPP